MQSIDVSKATSLMDYSECLVDSMQLSVKHYNI